jgi:hypothetical protein
MHQANTHTYTSILAPLELDNNMEDCKCAVNQKVRRGDQYRLLHCLYGPSYILFFLFGCHRMWELFFKYILCPHCMEKFWEMQNDNSSKTALGVSALCEKNPLQNVLLTSELCLGHHRSSNGPHVFLVTVY